MPLRLSQRVSVVTGSGSGIGRAVALALSSEGARVIVADIDRAKAFETAERINSSGGTAIPFGVDVADPASVDKLVDFVHEKLGPLDILVNNAAVQVSKLIEDTSPEEW